MDRRQETATVKACLKAHGIPVRRVSHGHGSDYWWLHIRLESGGYDYYAMRERVHDIVGSLIGRNRLDKVLVS